MQDLIAIKVFFKGILQLYLAIRKINNNSVFQAFSKSELSSYNFKGCFFRAMFEVDKLDGKTVST